MRTEELLTTMLRSFFVITTGVVLSMYVFCLIFAPEASFSLADLGRILLMSLVSDLTYVIHYARKELSKKQMLLRTVLHAAALAVVLLFLARAWAWVNLDSVAQVAVFLALVAGVYAAVSAVGLYRDKKLADKLNDRLQKRYHS
ncbi:MAG: DUF3021 domain-containing protein [Oscillospiraceae bacterium]|jgi:hypothetical protein|nr:DUF3021 domain-containing protein [Oscillospiraceae bacterium]